MSGEASELHILILRHFSVSGGSHRDGRVQIIMEASEVDISILGHFSPTWWLSSRWA